MTHANRKIEVEPGNPEDWYSREPSLIPAETKRRAAAEWAAMDARGNLPQEN